MKKPKQGKQKEHKYYCEKKKLKIFLRRGPRRGKKLAPASSSSSIVLSSSSSSPSVCSSLRLSLSLEKRSKAPPQTNQWGTQKRRARQRKANQQEQKKAREEGEEEKRGQRQKKAERASWQKPRKPRNTTKNKGLRQLSRTPWFDHGKEAILEKAVTKFGFWDRDKTHYVSSGFGRFFFFFAKTENTNLGPKKVCRVQGYQEASSEQTLTQVWARKCDLRSLSDKQPYFYQGVSGWAWKIKQKTEKSDTSRLVGTPLLSCSLLSNMYRFREGLKLENADLRNEAW